MLLAIYQIQGTVFLSEVIYNFFLPLLGKFFFFCKAESYKDMFIRNFIKVMITEIKMSNYDL